jgi:Uma2 family endonuclease
MATTAVTEQVAATISDAGGELTHPVSVNIKPILDSVAGKLTDEEIDQWFVDLEKANEENGLHLEMTCDGELIISPMVNRDGGMAEGQFFVRLFVWAEAHAGEAYGPNANMRLPDGSRIRPDALWLSPEQVAALPPVSEGGAITVCPAFVAEIVSGTDTLPPLQRKMERYITNGAQLGWLIDPYRRQVHVYRAGVDAEVMNDPETVSGDPVMPGFVFEVRQRIFALHADAEGA